MFSLTTIDFANKVRLNGLLKHKLCSGTDFDSMEDQWRLSLLQLWLLSHLVGGVGEQVTFI